MKVSEKERHLGVIMHSSATPPRLCVEAVKRANKILVVIKRTIVSRDKAVVYLGCINSW